MTEMNIGIVSKTVAPITYYVRTSGNNANTGITEDAALATIQAAIDHIPRFVAHEIIIDIGPGTFAGVLMNSRTIDGGKGKSQSKVSWGHLG